MNGGLGSSVAARGGAYEFLRFLVVGGVGAFLYIALSSLVLAMTDLPLHIVSISVHALLIPIMFVAQRSVTFRSAGAALPEFWKYAALQIVCISTSTALLAHFASSDWRVNACVFAAIASASALLSFVVCRLAIFSRGRLAA